MKNNPILQAVYQLEREEGSIQNVSSNDPRVKRIAEMVKNTEVNENAKKVAELLDLGYRIKDIAKYMNLKPTSISRIIRVNKLVIKYIVIEDTCTRHKKIFKGFKDLSKALENLGVEFTHRQLSNALSSSKLIQGRYKMYRVKKINRIKVGG